MKYLGILIRYFLALILAFPNLFIFYFIFTPLTLYFSYFLISVFYSSSIVGSSIIFQNKAIELIPACIAGSAYYLLTILNLTTPMPIKKRVSSLLFSYFSLLILNSLRILVMACLFVNNPLLFGLTHLSVWYILSTIFVVLIWFLTVWLFEIKSVPVYTDLKLLKKSIRK